MRNSEDHVCGEGASSCQAPLLIPSPSYHDGCPGCRLDRTKATSDGALPIKLLLVVALLSLSNRSALLIGRFMTSTPWGIVADRYGHKPVIFISTLSSFIFLIVFGFSTNYWITLISRFLIGAGNGMAATIRPSEKLPAIFPSGSLFDRFPYAFPSVCIAMIPLSGFVSCIWLPESVHNHPKSGRKLGNEISSEAIDGNINDRFRTAEDAVVESGLAEQFQGEDNDVNKQLWTNRGFMAAVVLSALWILHSMAYSEGCNITGGFILVNNSVVMAQRGVANGITMSAMSAFQAIGPAVAGIIFTWSEQRVDASFLPGMWMVFSILSALSFFAFLATLKPLLPASLNYPLQEG